MRNVWQTISRKVEPYLARVAPNTQFPAVVVVRDGDERYGADQVLATMNAIAKSGADYSSTGWGPAGAEFSLHATPAQLRRIRKSKVIGPERTIRFKEPLTAAVTATLNRTRLGRLLQQRIG